MAEWSNAVDSKSIVLFTGYLGFESLSLRHKNPLAGFYYTRYRVEPGFVQFNNLFFVKSLFEKICSKYFWP